MNFADYQAQVGATARYPTLGHPLVYPALGLAGEAGEVANVIKKIPRDYDGHLIPEVKDRIVDELGDVLWYITACAREIGVPLDEIAEKNIEKVQTRHAEYLDSQTR